MTDPATCVSCDDETELTVGDRGEAGGAGAQHDAGRAVGDERPLLVTLGRGERRR